MSACCTVSIHLPSRCPPSILPRLICPCCVPPPGNICGLIVVTADNRKAVTNAFLFGIGPAVLAGALLSYILHRGELFVLAAALLLLSLLHMCASSRLLSWSPFAVKKSKAQEQALLQAPITSVINSPKYVYSMPSRRNLHS